MSSDCLMLNLPKPRVRAVLAESWPDSAGDVDLLEPVLERVGESLEGLGEVRTLVASEVAAIQSLLGDNVTSGIEVDNKSRELRKRLDQVEEGVGAVTRDVEGPL